MSVENDRIDDTIDDSVEDVTVPTDETASDDTTEESTELFPGIEEEFDEEGETPTAAKEAEKPSEEAPKETEETATAKEDETAEGEKEGEEADDSEFEEFDERLRPLAKLDKESATALQGVLDEHTQLVRAGYEPQQAIEKLQHYDELSNQAQAYGQTIQQIQSIGEHINKGSIDAAMSLLGVDPQVLEAHFVSKALAREEGTLGQFESEQEMKKVAANNHLQSQQIQAQQAAYEAQQRQVVVKHWQQEVLKDAAATFLNDKMDDPQFAFREFDNIFTSLPEHERTAERAFQLSKDRWHKQATRLGFSDKTPVANPELAKSKRPAALNPPSSQSRGVSAVNTKKNFTELSDFFA